MAKKKTSSEEIASVKAVKEKYGEDSIMFFDSSSLDVEFLSTGIMSIDLITGGGIPRGRVIEVFGPESSGKTTLCLQICAQSQRKGELVAYIDAENALDPSWAERLGVDVGTMLISQPGSAEEGLGIAKELIEQNEAKLIVIDSVAALTPMKELEGEIGDAHVGMLARIMGQSMRMLVNKCKENNVTLLMINQLRSLINTMPGAPTETTPGGRALKFAASMRIDVRRVGQVKSGEDVVGAKTKFRVVKNKVAPPFRQCEIDLYYDNGICPASDLLDVGLETKVLTRSGAWFSFKDSYIGQGKEKARKFLFENPIIMQEIRDAVLAIGSA